MVPVVSHFKDIGTPCVSIMSPYELGLLLYRVLPNSTCTCKVNIIIGKHFSVLNFQANSLVKKKNLTWCFHVIKHRMFYLHKGPAKSFFLVCMLACYGKA